jgi:hypothetical protein
MNLWLSENQVRISSFHLWGAAFPFISHRFGGFFPLPGFATKISKTNSIGYQISSLTIEYDEACNGEFRRTRHLKPLSAST